MTEHPLYRMWKDRADQEYEHEERMRVAHQRSFEMTMNALQAKADFWHQVNQQCEEYHNRRLPWYDLWGRIERRFFPLL